MKIKIKSILILALFFTLNLYGQEAKKILFVGNSITYYNNMPQTFEAIANEKGDAVTVTVYAPGGAGFIHHVGSATLQSHFEEGGWDYVILQPGSSESISYSETIEATLVRAQILKERVLEHSPCAKILFYEISYGVWGDTLDNLNTYNNTMDLIRKNVEYWADETELFFAPAGEAVRTAWNNDTDTLLWGSTGDIHPNAKGSYLIACTIYASIFQKPSLGTLITDSLTPTEASFYQELADDTVLNNLSDWRINIHNQHTDFDFEVNNNTVNFTNQSENIDSVIWDFGDGTTATTLNPTHSFNAIGTYTVSLKTFKNNCEETISKTIEITSLSIHNTEELKVSVYPNPFKNYFNISNHNATTSLRLFNISGQDVTKKASIIYENSNLKINTRNLPKGIYWLQIGTEKFTLLKQ